MRLQQRANGASDYLGSIRMTVIGVQWAGYGVQSDTPYKDTGRSAEINPYGARYPYVSQKLGSSFCGELGLVARY